MAETPDQSTSVASLLLGIALGAAIGAVAALLYAPKPGKETRDDLVERLDEVKANIEETARAFSESARTKIAETRTDLEQALATGRTAAKSRADELRQQTGL
jgi:gas vesicle protein